jgi:hypothetical protein
MSSRYSKRRAVEITRRARDTLARLNEGDREHRRTRMAAYRGLNLVRQIFAAPQLKAMNPADRQRWQERRRHIDEVLSAIARRGFR